MLSLVFPTFRESENLPHLIPMVEDALKGVPFEIIIVDDDSPDRTWEVARKLAETRPHLHVIRRVGRRGLSSAVIEGFLAAKGDIVAVADADGQHDLSLLPRLVTAIEQGADMAIGSRYVEGGSVGEWDERRYALSRMGTWFAQKLCAVPVLDPMSGFFALRRSMFEQVLPSLNPKGFKILLDLLVHAPRNSKVVELPFTFRQRLRGESKLSMAVQFQFLEYLYDVTIGRYIPLLLLKYCLVGLLGVGVNLFAFILARSMFQLATPWPLLIGIEAAIIFNFLLNNSWTFRHAKLRGLPAIAGFCTYNLACAIGAFATVAITTYAAGRGWHLLPSVAIGAAFGMVWNYTMSRMITWRT